MTFAPWRRARAVLVAVSLVSSTAVTWRPAAAQTGGSPGEPVSRVLVLPFSAAVDPDAPAGAGASLWLGEAAALLTADGLADHGFGVLSREERILAFEQLQLPMPAALTRATMIRVGEILGATEIVFGEVSLGATLVVRAKTVHLAQARRLPDVVEEAPLGELFDLFGRVSARIAGGKLPETATIGLPSAARMSLETFENYVKGLVAATPSAQRRFLELALTGAPSDPRVLTALWEVYTAEGLHEEAVAAASAVPADLPGARGARFRLALSLIELRRYDGAMQTLSALMDDEPSAAVANAMGVIELRRSPAAPAAAARAFAAATDAEAGHADYLFNRGYAHARAGDGEGALYWLRESVRFDAAHAEAHVVMAAVLASQGRSAEAGREWELARLLGADDALEAAVAGRIVPEGLEILERAFESPAVLRAEAAIANPALRDHEATAVYHLEQARAFLARNQDREAAGELRRAIYLAPYADEPHLLLGRIHLRAGRLDEAIDELRVAIWSRDTASARIALAEALIEAGDLEAARREARQAIVLAPGSEAAREVLRRAGGATRVVPYAVG